MTRTRTGVRRWLPAVLRRRPAATPADPEVVARHAELLAAYAEVNTRANDAARARRRLRELVDQIPDGVWAGWRKTHAKPARVVDMEQVRTLLTHRGIEVPMRDGAPRLEVGPA